MVHHAWWIGPQGIGLELTLDKFEKIAEKYEAGFHWGPSRNHQVNQAKGTLVNKDIGSETLESVANQANQIQINIDDSDAQTTYSSLVRVGGSAEELVLDFSGPLRPTGPKSAVMKVDQRIIMNPWAAKRLHMAIEQAIQRYEETYGNLEVDERKRRVAQPQSASKPN